MGRAGCLHSADMPIHPLGLGMGSLRYNLSSYQWSFEFCCYPGDDTSSSELRPSAQPRELSFGRLNSGLQRHQTLIPGTRKCCSIWKKVLCRYKLFSSPIHGISWLLSAHVLTDHWWDPERDPFLLSLRTYTRESKGLVGVPALWGENQICRLCFYSIMAVAFNFSQRKGREDRKTTCPGSISE